MEDEARRSRRLLGEAPEVFSTPSLWLRKDGKNALEKSQAADRPDLDENIAKASSVVSVKSRTRTVCSKSSTNSEATRLKLKAKLDTIEALGKAEQEAILVEQKAKQETLLAQQRLEQQRKTLDLKLQMQELKIDAGFDEESESMSEELDNFIETEVNSNNRVENWVRTAEFVPVPKNTMNDEVKEAFESKPAPIDKVDLEPTKEKWMQKLVSRQTVPTDLPIFNGEPEEWPMFYSQYYQTTELCGLSDGENMVRLMKCLKGTARETVLPILGLPENAEDVMETLKMMFGRKDQIIRTMIAKVKAAPMPTRSKPEHVISFYNLITNMVKTMKRLGALCHLNNPTLLEELVQKVSFDQQMQWVTYRMNIEEPTLEDFANWMKIVAKKFTLLPPNRVQGLDKVTDGKKENKKMVLIATQKDDKKCCHCSKEGHKLIDCKSFLKADHQAKWKSVKDNRLCFTCLIPGHRSGDCRKKTVCSIDGCEKFHHKSLHKASSPSESQKPAEKVGELVAHVNYSDEDKEVLLKILPVKLSGPNGEINTYAMLDEGSTITMIDSSLATKLGLEGQKDPLCIQWTNDVWLQEKDSKRVSVGISGSEKIGKKFRLENARTMDQMALPHQTVDMEKLREEWPYLEDIPFSSMVNVQPLVLIGSDNILLTTARKVRQGHWNDPIATKTWLGWIVHGNLPKHQCKRNEVSFHVCEKKDSAEVELTQLIRDSFSTESFGVKIIEENRRSKEDERAFKILQCTTRRVGDRFETGLLWKSDDIKLPESRNNAMRRLHCMEKKMDQDPAFYEAYSSKIQDYISKGYCRKLTQDEAAKKGPRTYYLPHFGVFNPNKPGKLRFVFDAAAKSHGVSLNDCLLKGPDFLNALPGVLMRFRRHAVGIVGDIREMFHQIRIIQDDVDSQRFLWRGKDRNGEPDEYVMQVMIFGAACSPASALYVKDVNAKEFVQEFPETALSAVENTYMDDNLHGATTDEEAQKRISEAIELFGRGGFEIVNWASSSKKAIHSLAPDLRAKSLISLTEDSILPTERVLGLRWDAENDKFVFILNFPKVKEEILNCSRTPTKREMASLIMSVYDPLGIVVQFTIKGRILFQDAWLLKTGWDDVISEELFQKWKWWVQELSSITSVSVPRCYSTYLGEASNVQLHIFVDASSKAFACVSYLRICHSGGIEVSFVLARARVAPLKPLSIPRLELQAAVLGCRMAQTIRKEIQVAINSTVYWSDSQTVISWIRSDRPSPKVFVSHRIGEILETTEVCEWRWVPTGENAADEATRCNPEINFHPESRWYTGPNFLKLHESEWPKENISLAVEENELAVKQNVVLVITKIGVSSLLPQIDRFSSWIRLLRTTAQVGRFAKKWRKKLTNEEITTTEIEEAEISWLKEVQLSCFPDEMKALESGKSIAVNSRLRFLSPFLDSSGIIRLKGRIDCAEVLQLGTRSPIILDPKHRYTQLLLLHLHEQAAHQGIETVLNEVRMKYWVLDGRTAVKRAFRKCRWCSRRRATPHPPEMGNLPEERVLKTNAPFTFTGVDYFGPIMVLVNRKHVKRYGVLFTCLSVRAVHLELAPDLTTDSAINAIRRFIARRGIPKEMLSDNGTNFRGADRELKESIGQINGDEIQRTFSTKGMIWKFNPPAAPHMGGIWERLIKSVKVALSATLKDVIPREDVLLTLLAETEFILNSRPLTHVSVDLNDPECLTPNHFLLGHKIGVNVPGKFGDGNLNLRSQWRLVQELTEKLWGRWVKEYLPTLTKRTKWHHQVDPVKIGDVVLVVDNNLPRNSWPLGRIVNVHPGKDGQVRVVQVKTKDGIYTRPVTKICVLDVNRSDEETVLHQGEEM